MRPPVKNSQSSLRLTHIDFNRGRTRRYPLCLPHGFVEDLPPLYTQKPGSPRSNLDTVVEYGWAFDGVQFTLHIDGVRLVVGGVAWGPRNAGRLYAFLADFSGCSVCPAMPAGLPWLGTVATPLVAELPRRAQSVLLAWTRSLAAAIIEHALACN